VAGASAVALALVAAGGDGGHGAAAARFPHDADTLLAAGAGNLESSASFRLTMRVAMPGVGGRAAHRMDMTGVWDARRPAGRMDGVLENARATVLSIEGTEYVSLPASLRRRTGRAWLRAARGTRTFAVFPDVHRVATILRTARRATASGAPGGAWHVRGEIDRAAALAAIPDPALKEFVRLLPSRTGLDLWTDDAGRPARIRLTMPAERRPGTGSVTPSEGAAPKGESGVEAERRADDESSEAATIEGTVELSAFGARPRVAEPTADQILTSPPKGTT
ncbi:LolA-like protein, partial [Actinomadura rubrobrunea]